MNWFNNSQNVVVRGNTFNLSQHQAPSAFVQLRWTIADGAMHNSGERFDPPKCYPGTRTAILEELLNWIIANDRKSFMRWLFGPAGAGKSSILQKMAEICAERNLLIASFFFSRTAALRNDEKRLITTIAYQLAQVIPETQPYIEAAIEHDPAFFSKSLESQLQHLIIQPLNHASASIGKKRVHWAHLILIDGLDECRSPAVQKHILTCLLNSAVDCKFPILFLVSSCPETHLVLTFNQDVFQQGCARTALDDDYRREADIRLFLNGTFRDIKTTHPLRAYLPPDWPSHTVINDLVRKSSGQFIYPATVARFISPPEAHPAQCLDIVLGISALDSVHETPFAELDTLYSHILSSLPNKQTSSRILALLTFPDCDFTWTPEQIDSFLGLRPGFAEQIVNKLAAVMKLDWFSHIRIIHASLPDFLFDKKRSQQFYIDLPEEATYFVKLSLQHVITGTNKTAIQDAIKHIEVYCEQALPTEELREHFLQLDLPAMAQGKWRQDITLRKEPMRKQFNLNFVLQDPLPRIIYHYLDSSRRIKFPDVDNVATRFQRVVEHFLESQVPLYRSTSPTLLMLLVLHSVQPELFNGRPLNLHDRMYSPCSWVDFLLAPAHRNEFEYSVLVDETSLRLRNLYWDEDCSWYRHLKNRRELYAPFHRKHLSADDLAKTATQLASFVADLSSQGTWSSITKEDRHRASLVGWDTGVAVTTMSKQDFDNSLLTMKHQAYERALQYLPLLLPKAAPDSALSNILRHTTVMLPCIYQWNHHTSKTTTRLENCQIFSTPNDEPMLPSFLVAAYTEIKVQVEEAIARYLLRCESTVPVQRLCSQSCAQGEDQVSNRHRRIQEDQRHR